MKKMISLIIVLSFVMLAQEKVTESRTKNFSTDSQSPMVYSPSGIVIFQDNMNAGCAVADLQSRGWTWINQDGGGTSATFSGNVTVFTAYEGPDSGYCGQNYNGANGYLIDQWLISPVVNVHIGDTLSFYYRSVNASTTNYDDSIYVRLAPNGGNTIPDFTTNLGRYKVPLSTWTNWRHVFTINGNIRFAIQYYITNGGVNGSYSDYWGLDLVQVLGGPNVPVELTSFTASSISGNVELNWTTATEKNNKGFEVERKVNRDYITVGFVSGNGTTTEVKNYNFIDKNLMPGKYFYRLKQVDFDGTYEYSKAIEVEVAQPTEFALNQNYPNPFNPSTKINFSLSVDSKVTLSVFNILGQKVATLINGNLSAGNHSAVFNANSMQSGIYLVKIEANGNNGQNFSSIKKMTLMK